MFPVQTYAAALLALNEECEIIVTFLKKFCLHFFAITEVVLCSVMFKDVDLDFGHLPS
jgi:hypothetical protein